MLYLSNLNLYVAYSSYFGTERAHEPLGSIKTAQDMASSTGILNKSLFSMDLICYVKFDSVTCKWLLFVPSTAYAG
jgi:hypothetical protein